MFLYQHYSNANKWSGQETENVNNWPGVHILQLQLFCLAFYLLLFLVEFKWLFVGVSKKPLILNQDLMHNINPLPPHKIVLKSFYQQKNLL